jgi:hypothetical protein
MRYDINFDNTYDLRRRCDHERDPKLPRKRLVLFHLLSLGLVVFSFSFLSSLVSFLSCDGLVYHIQSHFLSFVRKKLALSLGFALN